MLITYHGHSEFYVECASGFRLLTDPYDAHVGYPMGVYPADAVTVTHGHGDHSFTDKAAGTPAIIDSEGVWLPHPEVKITAIPSVHDGEGGAKRGKNLIMKIETEGLTLAHLGDQGAPLTQAQLASLGQVDILMVPVGGFFTIDAEQAAALTRAVRPRIVIPMHYKTAANADWPIADERAFLRLINAPDAQPMPLLRVTKGDLSEQPGVALMAPRP